MSKLSPFEHSSRRYRSTILLQVHSAAFLAFLLLCGLDAHSARVYKCTDSMGRPIFRDTPCDSKAIGKSLQVDSPARKALSGEELDKAMWLLLEAPYKADDKQFIDYVREYDLIHKQDSDGDTVLGIAALNGQIAVIEYLVANGAEFDSTNQQGYTILSFAMRLDNPSRLALLRHGADIDHPVAEARTPLINAVLFQDLDTVKFLLSHGANSDHLDDSGVSALFCAASRGNMDLVKTLVESGANVNAGSTHTPLKGALANIHLLFSTYLKFKGATL